MSGEEEDIDRIVEIERLAGLNVIDFEANRRKAAKHLGLRTPVLDQEVAKKRRELGLDIQDKVDDGQGRAVKIPDVSPWPEPVDGERLADTLAMGIRTYVAIPAAAADAIALWVIATWLVNSFTTAPRLAITSPTKGCGKTTVLRVLNVLTRRPKRAGSISPAALFRVVGELQPTLLLDETEKYVEAGSDLHALLNEGHAKGGTVIRVLGDKCELREFGLFGFVAFARNGRLPDDLEQRSIVVEMQRRKAEDRVAELRDDRCDTLHRLATMCARWSADNEHAVGEVDPDMYGLINREADNWRPLFTIADVIGGDWPERAREAARTLARIEPPSDVELLLGTLAMLAQWISLAAQDAFRKARTEPLITLGSAPLAEPGFRSVVLGQLGESRLVAAIDTDVAGEQAHAKALDADTRGPLRDIHRRVGTAILFESSGGQTDKVAHLPELRFALGEMELDTTTIDNAASALEDRSYYVRKVGTDGFRVGYQPTMKKVVSDRRASLDEDTEIKPAMRKLVEDEFRKGASIPVVPFPADGSEIPDTPRLSLVLAEPEEEWSGTGPLRAKIAEWTRNRGKSPRLYPGALVWCLKKSGRDLRDKVEIALAWKRVAREVADGTLGGDFDRGDRADLHAKVKDSEEAAKDAVWGDYRFATLADGQEADGLKVIDLGAGHSSSGETLCGRVVGTLKSEALLNESVGAGYIERNWPPALKDSGAWPLTSLRQSFLNGSLTRLIDPDVTLKSKIVEFVAVGDFGLASGKKADGTYERMWFNEPVGHDEVAFEADVFLLRKATAEALKSGQPAAPVSTPPGPEPGSPVAPVSEPGPTSPTGPEPGASTRTLRLSGNVPPEVWNRLGTKILPKLRSGSDLKIGLDFSVTVAADTANGLASDLRQILEELGLGEAVTVE